LHAAITYKPGIIIVHLAEHFTSIVFHWLNITAVRNVVDNGDLQALYTKISRKWYVIWTQLLLTSGISRLGTGLPSFALGPSFMAMQGIHDSLSNFEDSN